MNNRSNIFAALLTASLAAGCTVTDSGSTSSGESSGSSGSWTSGGDSSNSSSKSVPKRADQVEQGKGSLEYTANRSGTLYVVDDESDEVVFDVRVTSGDNFVLNPKSDRATINGTRAYKGELAKDHRHRIYFLPDLKLSNKAKLAVEGKKQLAYVAPSDGYITVVQDSGDKVLLVTDIKQGQTFTLTPGKDEALVNKKSVYNGNLEKDAKHRVYFEPSN